jgi:Fic family protein
MKKLEKETRNTKVFTVLDYLFQKPFLNIPEIKKLLKSEYQTAKRAVLELVKYEILEEVESKQTAQLYRATKIMDILNNV